MQPVKSAELEPFLERNPLVVDVRPLEQAEPSRFQDALRLPLKDIQDGNHALPKDRPILLVCERGLMSELAGLYLEAGGYAQVYNLEGGLRKLGQKAASSTAL
ncbi:MAG: rhodanese-like domain-containing protein [Meiothermus sp.]